MISQARKASGGLSASAKYRGMSELLRPKDNDPRSGSWTRFSYEKGSTFFAMLDADIAFAEACIKSGGAITARNRWKGGPDKAVSKKTLLEMSTGMKPGWVGALSEEAIQTLREEVEAEFTLEIEQNYDHLLEMLLEDEVEAVIQEAAADGAVPWIFYDLLEREIDEALKEVYYVERAQREQRQREAAWEAARLAELRKEASEHAERAAKAAARSSGLSAVLTATLTRP